MKITESRITDILYWLGEVADHAQMFEEIAMFRDTAVLIRQLQAELQDAWHAGLDEGREQGRGKDHAYQPPSVPVGVEAALSLLRAGHWREVHAGRRYMRLEVTYDYVAWERLMEQVEAALAQQPAAVEAKDAEIEALKVEVAAQRTRADAMAGQAIKHADRAERLAEALRKVLGHTGHARPLPDQLHIDLLASVERIAKDALLRLTEGETDNG